MVTCSFYNAGCSHSIVNPVQFVYTEKDQCCVRYNIMLWLNSVMLHHNYSD